MKRKRIKSIHQVTKTNQVVSVFFQTLPVNYITDNWNIRNCTFIGAIIGKSRRANNDWFNGDKLANKYDNKSTGKSLDGFNLIISTISNHVINTLELCGISALLINGTNEKRVRTYDGAIRHICKRHGLTLEISYDINTDNDTLYIISV